MAFVICLWLFGFQTTEDGGEGEACHGTAEEENGERGTENDEEGAKDSSKAFLTFLGTDGHLRRKKKKRSSTTIYYFYFQLNMSPPPCLQPLVLKSADFFRRITDFPVFPLLSHRIQCTFY